MGKRCEIKCCAVLPVVGDWEAGLTGLDLGRSPEEGGRGSLLEIKLGTTRFGQRLQVLIIWWKKLDRWILKVKVNLVNIFVVA